jgi:hypothetical protein
MVLHSEDFTEQVGLCSLSNVPPASHGKYGNNEEGNVNCLPLSLFIGWVVQTIKQLLSLAIGYRAQTPIHG